MKFNLGRTAITPAAFKAVSVDEICRALDRHVCGDWGDANDAERAENELALKHGFHLMSVFHTAHGTKFFVLTECKRTVTTVLLPADY